MKYIIAVLAIFLLFSSTFERRLRRSHKYRHHRFLGPAEVKQSSVYQFLQAMVKEMTNDPKVTKAIDDCSAEIEGWSTLKAEETDPQEKEMESDNQTVVSNFTDLAIKAIDACCAFRDKIAENLTALFRRYVRLFMQGKLRRVKFWRWGFSSLWNKIKETAKTVASAVVAGAQKIGETYNHAKEWVNKKVDEFEDYVKQKLTEMFEPIVNKIKDWFKAKFEAWLDKHPVLKQILKFTVCFIKNDGVKAIAKVWNVFSGVLSNIAGLFTGTAWIKLIINAVCGWRLIKKGFAYLDLAKKEADAMKKAAYRGCATADFLMVAAGETGIDNETVTHY